MKKLKVSKADQLGKAPANKKLGEADAAQEDLLEKAGASKRQLVPRDSDVTMGSEDIPDIFKTPASKKAKAASGLEKPSPSSSKLVSQQRPGSRLHAAMGYDLEKSRKKAKPKAKPVLKRPACLGKGTLKKPASLGKGCLGNGTSAERKPWVKLRQVDPQETRGWLRVARCT